MSVNLSKNGTALMQAYKDVVDGKVDTNWALFTYEGNSNDIRLAETGDGGLEEMVEELNSGKVMYAFCRVQDPNSGLPKYVLINWTGEGVKDTRKGVCANHVSTMANFLKGAHVTINARADDDVEPEVILQKVSKASGASFNFHKQTPEFRDAPRGPVGSVYKKVNAVEEIQQTNKDDFWSQAQRDEEVRRRDESKRAELERQEAERDRREMDEKQAKERERRAKERAQQIEQDKLYQKKREEEEREMETREMEEKQAKERERRATERAQQAQQDKLLQQKRDEEEREREQQRQYQQENGTKRSGINFAASVQKANEAKSLISQRSFNPRDIFKQREQSFESSHIPSPARPGKLQSPFLSQKSFEREAAPAPAVIPAYSMHPLSPVSPVSPVSPAAAEVPAYSLTPLSPVTPVSPVVSHSLAPAEVPAYSVHRLSPASPELSHSPAAAVSPTPDSPVHHADTTYTEEEEWSDEFDDDAGEATPEPTAAAEDLYQTPRPEEEDLYEDVYQDVSPAGDQNQNQNLRARALYDYQAVDDSEITFDPDDIITDIDMVDESWWRGTGPDGRYGMFPANYVELL
ncbi:drebrin-like protein B [Centropristis striata]|uniref:drebrin-like protein B n=1 Tax=Centropristis striata TaxID=184440 RepID=UPI0027E1FA5E|nr:drebrin-like protein B [Centropristis striata]